MHNEWKTVLNDIEKSVSPSVFSTWFSDIDLVSIEDGDIIIGTSNIFRKRQLETKFFSNIKDAFLKNSIPVNTISFEVLQSSTKPKIRNNDIVDTKRLVTKLKEERKISNNSSYSGFESGLNEKYRLDNFIIGSNNDLAVSVARNVIASPGKNYNPFFLYGGSGLGKTHLVQAIGNELHKKDPSLKILYIPINHFYSDFISSITRRRPEEFTKKFLGLDVLIVDDFQMIIGKSGSQEQFFNIFNDLYNLNKQIIVTSDRLPSQIETLDPRLAGRLAMAGAIDIQLPNFEDKCAILKAKAEFLEVDIEDEVIEYIAENIKTNIRDLESEFKTILAISDWRHIRPIQLIEEGYTSALASATRVKTTSAKQIVSKVAKFYNLSVEELKSKNRSFSIKNARQVAMFLLSKELSMSTNKIAQEVGVKDHSTVMHGIKKIETELRTDFTLRDQVEGIKDLIYR